MWLIMQRWKWLLAGLAVLILGITILEFKQPYYFVQDDNFAECLPVILQGCRVFMRGILLDWSPSQYLGYPVAGNGGYALTYPVTYLSYGIARYLLGNELLVLDVFCVLHLIAAYFVTYALLRRNNLNPSLATAGSLAYTLSGYTLIAGRSWFTVIASLPWIPLLFLSATLLLQQNKPTWKWIAGTGGILGVFFHAGHAQTWAYACMFFLFSMVILFCLGKLSLYKLACLLPAFLFGLALVMPLFIPQWNIVAGLPRFPSGEGIPFKGIAAMLLPFPMVAAPHPETGWGTIYDREHMTPLYYSGTLFTAVFFGTILVLAAALLFKSDKRLLLKRFTAANIWFVCALIAFILALGDRGLLWTIQAKLPLLNKFRMPFKFILFFNLFVVMGSGMILERRIGSAFNHKFWKTFFAVTVCGLMLYNVNLATASFYSYGDRPSHSTLPEGMHDILGSKNFGWRVLSLSPERSPKPGYIFSLNHNFPTFFNLNGFGGYTPFIEQSLPFARVKEILYSHPLEAARIYGVKWVIVEEGIDESEMIDSRNRALADFFIPRGQGRSRYLDYTLVELDDPHPAAFVEGNPHAEIPVYARDNRLDIDVSRIYPTGGRVVINTLWLKGIAVMNGKNKLKSEADFWGRVVADVPPHVRAISFRYITPWKAGFIAGLLCLLCAILSYFFINRIRWPGLEN